jgi:dTDP-4-dehydrorhamnose 3,5-epimerase
MDELSIAGLQLIDLKSFSDDRGNLLPISLEALSSDFRSSNFSQINIATSFQGVIRGMHWQNDPYEQGKLIKVLSGSVLDIAVDIRPNSSTFGKFCSVKLEEGDEKAFWIPPGFAHGFQTLSDQSKVMYLVDAPFNLSFSDGIFPLDEELSLPWVKSFDLVLSEKDQSAQSFSEKFR